MRHVFLAPMGQEPVRVEVAYSLINPAFVFIIQGVRHRRWVFHNLGFTIVLWDGPVRYDFRVGTGAFCVKRDLEVLRDGVRLDELGFYYFS